MLTREDDILTLTKIWSQKFLSTENMSITLESVYMFIKGHLNRNHETLTSIYGQAAVNCIITEPNSHPNCKHSSAKNSEPQCS